VDGVDELPSPTPPTPQQKQKRSIYVLPKPDIFTRSLQLHGAAGGKAAMPAQPLFMSRGHPRPRDARILRAAGAANRAQTAPAGSGIGPVASAIIAC
jgi:hypothetical protein